jgi:hypothetical protein
MKSCPGPDTSARYMTGRLIGYGVRWPVPRYSGSLIKHDRSMNCLNLLTALNQKVCSMLNTNLSFASSAQSRQQVHLCCTLDILLGEIAPELR